MDFQQIRYEVADAILTITLDRPDRLNAWTPTMASELIEAFDRADADDEVRAIVVTGAGRAYRAGADLAGGGETFDWRERQSADEVPRDNGGQVTLRIFESTKPVMAAINGPAVGVGITMTLPMDVRLAAESAKIGFVFARRGIVPEACSSWFLPRVVGISQAMEWVATGRVFSAEEALAGRLVRSVHAPLDLIGAARAVAAASCMAATCRRAAPRSPSTATGCRPRNRSRTRAPSSPTTSPVRARHSMSHWRWWAARSSAACGAPCRTSRTERRPATA